MKRFSVIVLFILIQYAFSGLINAQIAPQITSEKPHYEFGEILQGQVVSHTFEIQNTGNAVLKIDRVRASCGCTAVTPEKNELNPGEKTNIKAEFDSHGRLGLQQKMIYVISNDPKTPQFQLSFNAVVVEKLSPPKDAKTAKLELKRNDVDFGNVEEGKVVEAKIDFKNAGSGPLEIVDVKTSCGCTAALLSSKKLAPGESGSLKIEFDSSGRDGKITRTVTLYSNDPENANQTITIHANIEKRKS